MCQPMLYTKIIPVGNNLSIFNGYGQIPVAKWLNRLFFPWSSLLLCYCLPSLRRLLFSSICFRVRFLEAKHTRRKLPMNPKRCVCPWFRYCLSVVLSSSLRTSTTDKAGGLALLLFAVFMESQTRLSQHSPHLKPAVTYKGVVVHKRCQCFGPIHFFRQEVQLKLGLVTEGICFICLLVCTSPSWISWSMWGLL